MKTKMISSLRNVAFATVPAVVMTVATPLQAFARERAQVVSVVNPEYTASPGLGLGLGVMFVIALIFLMLAIAGVAAFLLFKKHAAHAPVASSAPVAAVGVEPAGIAYCTHCGATVSCDAVFCVECGNKILD